MALRFLLPALAITGSVLAQDGCGNGGDIRVQNSGDASALGSCQTVNGNIIIDPKTTDDLDFGNLQAIKGDFQARGVSKLSSISGAGLRSISGEFALREVQILTNLNFPQLSSVGTVNWNALPNLAGLSFTTGLQTVKRMGIQNTGLQSLEGINLKSVDELVVVNNNYLNDISMQLQYVGTSLTLSANGDQVQASFPNMEWAYNISFRNVSSVDLPSLATLNGSMGFYNSFMESVSLPNVTEVGGSLAFVSNDALSNVSCPQLTKIGGGLQLANNTEVGEIDGFPELKAVGGAIDINGYFTDVKFPALKDVRGAMNLQSKEDIQDVCDKFKAMAGSNKVIKGRYRCASKKSNPGGINSKTSSGSEASSGSATGLYISGPLGVMGVLAAMFGML